MPKHTWTIAGTLSAIIVLVILGLYAWNQRTDLQQALGHLEQTTNTLAATQMRLEQEQTAAQEQTGNLNELKKELTGLKKDLVTRQTAIDQLKREKEQVTRAQKKLEDTMRAALESKDVTISELQGKLTVNILDRILFDSGEAVLKPEGEKVLEQIAAILAQHTNRQIHVIGHTDNVPIRSAARSRFASNWELSTSRATAAVRFLQEKANVDPRRLGAVGYGEFQPVADNGTAEGRAKNRRIAVVVLPEIFTPPDSAPTPAAPATSQEKKDESAPKE